VLPRGAAIQIGEIFVMRQDCSFGSLKPLTPLKRALLAQEFDKLLEEAGAVSRIIIREEVRALHSEET
jgi:hypothetical protein